MWIEGCGELPGRLVVISGPSGCGKSTLVRRLLSRTKARVRLSVSATTRAPRPGEVDGVDYHFITPEAFAADRSTRFLESAEYNGQCYGTPRAAVIEALAAGWIVLLEIEVQGALQVREAAPTALFVFIKAPSFAAMERRLLDRGTEAPSSLQHRLVRARHELAEAHWYDHQIINDEVEHAVDALDVILSALPT